MKIGTREIGPEHPVCIVAEMSANHNGDIAKAKELIDAAKWAGADLVKMQIYTADEMCLPGVKCPGPGPWEGQDLHELYKRAGTPWEWWPVLRDHAAQVGIPLFSSAFSPEAVQYLVREGCPAIKIASHEAAAAGGWLFPYGGPARDYVLIGSACTRLDAHALLSPFRTSADIVLWCPPGYPADALDPADMSWLVGMAEAMEWDESNYETVVGLSDNGGPDTRATSWSDAIRAGASMIEAHLKLRGTTTEDDQFSMTPDELQHLVRFVRERCERRPPDKPSPYRRSVWLTKPVKRGESVMEHVRMLRPFGGIEPSDWPYSGLRSARDLEPGPLRWEDVE